MATRNQILQAIADAEAIDAQPRYLNQSTKLMDPSQMVNQLGTPYNREGWTWPAQEDDEALYPITPDKTGFRFPNFTGIMSAARDKLAPFLGETPEKLAAYEAIMGDRKNLGLWDTQTGTYGGTEYDLQQTPSGLKVYSDLNPFGSNLYSGFGSESLEEMEQKKLDWALGRLRTGKGLSTHLRNVLRTRGYDERGNLVNFPDRGTQFGDTIPVGPIDKGGATTTEGYEGPPTRGFDPGIAARTQHPTERARTRGGYTDPGRGSYGPWMATGGRVGYVNGEFVDEDVNIAGPGFDVNENIEMASAVDPMDALNDMSLMIFKKPFDQLNDDEKQILFEMANDQAAIGQGEGLASLV